MYGDQENAVIKCALYLNLLESGRDTWEDVSPTQDCLSVLHELRNRVPSIANALLELRSDQGGRFVDVELQATRKTLLC